MELRAKVSSHTLLPDFHGATHSLLLPSGLTGYQVSHHQRVLGSNRKVSLSHRRRNPKLVLSEDGQSELDQQRFDQVQQARAFQPADRGRFFAHGCHDNRRHVDIQLLRVSSNRSSISLSH
jgi:hypothetical protein